MTKSLIIKVDQRAEQVSGPVRKILGLLQAKAFNQLVDVTDLSANPRLARKGSVTQEIETSLSESPELFPAKSKGLLIAATSYQDFERDRVRLTFQDPDVEGLLDGGHNALATGRFVLREAGVPETQLSRAKDWKSFQQIWIANRKAVEAVEDVLDFKIPVEIQVPASMTDDDVVNEFRSSLLEIGAARNNNVQLTDATKANQEKLFDELRAALPDEISAQVEWKSNDGGRIKVQDIVALAWIPLSRLDLPAGLSVNPNQLYRNKAVAVDAYVRLLKHKDVSRAEENGYGYELANASVASALEAAGRLPGVYDAIFEVFPEAYNKAGGSFGKISAVRIFDEEKIGERNPKYLRQRPKTPYFQKEVKYTCPDGFIWPFVYGLRTLLSVDGDGLISWREDPVEFVKDRATEIMRSYRAVIELGEWDPQKVGKNLGAYDFAEKAIANA
jgi:hypothetical protein